jgi:Cof subfamily protein (haloacid dehalogenase superfamily)
MLPGKKIQLLALDLDGTLLNSKKEITHATVAVVRAAHEQAAVRVVLATARPPRSVMPFYRQLNLDTPIINYNGALIYDPTVSQVLMHRPLPLKTARTIAMLARGIYSDVLVSGEILDNWYTDRVDGQYLTDTALAPNPNAIAPLEQWMTQAVTKLMLLGPSDKLTEIANAIRQDYLHQVSMVQTEDHILQIMHSTVSKAQALRVVAAEMGVAREHVMAIGDNANDVGMLTWAGTSVAMANSVMEALAAADSVTDTNDNDGVAKAIMQYLLS